MARSLLELETLVKAGGKVGRVELLKFVRLIPNSDNAVIIATIEDWLVRLEQLHGITEVDAKWLEQIMEDLRLHGRIQHETLIGAEPRPLFEKFRKAPELRKAAENVTE